MDPTLERALEKAWKGTCRVLFGRELEGNLADYRPWLCIDIPRPAKRSSHVNGEELNLAVDAYPKNAHFISSESLAQNRTYSLTMNQIKDIDSIAEALAEKCEYTGNRYLGNSAYAGGSDIVMDSQYVNNSTNIEESMYVDSSFMIRKGSKYIFGSGYLGKSEFIMRVIGTFNSKRCFESNFIADCSDTYFSHSCFASQNLLFCFGQRNASHRIGNLQLERSKYLQLKTKIMEEALQELEKKKRFPLLRQLVENESPAGAPKISIERKKRVEDMAPIERGFSNTCSVIFKKKLESVKRFEDWLSLNAVGIGRAKSIFGTYNYYPLDHSSMTIYPAKRRVSYEESIGLGMLKLDPGEIESLGSLLRSLGKIAYFTSEMYYGENYNYVDSPLVYHGSNVYKVYDITYGENAALCFLALNSKYVYGCRRILESQFSLKCYNSLYLNRCFELDSCNKCADSYFCHNSEGLSDCMFCFNLKGMRHMIGNTQLSKEEYSKAKEALVGQMAAELAKSGRLKWNIYNIGARQ